MIRFNCPSCKKALQVADAHAGALLGCPYCKTHVRAPQAAASPPAPPPPTVRTDAIAPRPMPAPPPVMPTMQSSPPPAPLPPSNGEVPGWKRTLQTVGRKSAATGKWVAREVGRTGAATWGQTVRLVSYGRNGWRCRSLRSREQRAQLALGERVLQAGGGDPQLRQQVLSLDQQIRDAEANKGSTRALKAQRLGLVQQIGAAALSRPAPVPGAEGEFQAATQVRSTLQAQAADLRAKRASLPPPDRAGWVRVGVGYSVLFLMLGLGMVWATGGFRRGPAVDGGPPDIAKLDTSLRLVPEDAAFYTASLRNREQVQAVTGSRAWQRLMAMRLVQQGWSEMQKTLQDPRGPFSGLVRFKNDSANRPLMDLLDDMWRQEIFIYGGPGWGDGIRWYREFIGESFMAGVDSGLNGRANPRDPFNGLLPVLKKLASGSQHIRIPELVVGFRLKNPDASAALKRLEALAEPLPPKLRQRLKLQKVADGDFLVLALDGSMVPWEDLPIFTETRGELNELLVKLRQAKLTVSLGVREGYLLFSVGESTEHLAKLGKGKTLADRSEVAPLAKFTDQRLTEISYVSKAYAAQSAITKKDVAGYGMTARQLLEKTPLPGELKTRINNDIDGLLADLQKYVPEPGASFAFSFLNGRGIERYAYDWAENVSWDGTKPLTLLNHLGGDPLFAGIGRAKSDPQQYRILTKFLKAVHGYVWDFGLPGVVDPQNYRLMFQDVKPILDRFDRATADLLLPALADGQSGMVIDAKLTSPQWFSRMPQANPPLPLPEVAFVFGISDGGKLRKAGAEYRTCVNETMALIGKLTNQQLPMLPPPESMRVNSGELFYYSLPPLVDKKLLPNVGLSGTVMTFSLSREHADRLLTPTPPKDPFLAAHADKPLSEAVTFNWAGTVDLAMAWVEFGIRNSGGPFRQPQEVEANLRQARDVAELLKVLRSFSSVTYYEGKAQVEHSETVLQDL